MRQLAIFLKYPTPGRVKTRLAEHAGDQAAASIARACAELTLRRLAAFQSQAVLYVDPPEDLAKTRAWLGPSWRLMPQQGRDLGRRLAAATAERFSDGASRVVVIGTDSPWLRPPRIDEAFSALHAHRLAIGPTDDGGYYLIGLSQPSPELFEEIAWSTPSVYEQTVAKARALGWPLHRLPAGYDIDRAEDLERFIREEASAFAASEPHQMVLAS